MWKTQEADHSKVFWASNDPSGWEKVKEAAEIRAEWNEYAKKDDKKKPFAEHNDDEGKLMADDTAGSYMKM